MRLLLSRTRRIPFVTIPTPLFPWAVTHRLWPSIRSTAIRKRRATCHRRITNSSVGQQAAQANMDRFCLRGIRIAATRTARGVPQRMECVQANGSIRRYLAHRCQTCNPTPPCNRRPLSGRFWHLVARHGVSGLAVRLNLSGAADGWLVGRQCVKARLHCL